jgi:hypothetical protein
MSTNKKILICFIIFCVLFFYNLDYIRQTYWLMLILVFGSMFATIGFIFYYILMNKNTKNE